MRYKLGLWWSPADGQSCELRACQCFITLIRCCDATKHCLTFSSIKKQQSESEPDSFTSLEDTLSVLSRAAFALDNFIQRFELF